MRLFGINITFGDPLKRERKRNENEVQRALKVFIEENSLDHNRTNNGLYQCWWEESMPKYALRISKKIDSEMQAEFIKLLCEYFRRRKMDIELDNNEIHGIVKTLREKTR